MSDVADKAAKIHFNPRSSCEERRQSQIHRGVPEHFNPRSSCEERQRCVSTARPTPHYFNPRSSCEERRHAYEHAPA